MLINYQILALLKWDPYFVTILSTFEDNRKFDFPENLKQFS